jgi:hypothetical protein
MTIELSTITFTEQDDIVPESGYDEQILNTGIVDTYAGNDRITGTGTGIDADSYGFKNEGILNTADGDDIITGKNISDSSSGGFNIINWGTLNTGEGDDLIDGSQVNSSDFTYSGIDATGTLNAGGGDDTITGAGTQYGIRVETGTLNMGEGNDLIDASGGYYWGIGIVLWDGGTIDTGNGDIISSIGVIYNEGVINTGDGADSIIADGGFQSGSNSSGSVLLGDGADYIKGFGSGDFYGGNGNDTLELTPGTYTVGIWGEGGESPIFTKGNQLMITSEFEKLKAGNTLYDFTNLTAGQIITVA